MQDPVCTCDGHTYERAAITHWLEKHDTRYSAELEKSGTIFLLSHTLTCISPLTRSKLAEKRLQPNFALRAQIVGFREQHNLPVEAPYRPPKEDTSTAQNSLWPDGCANFDSV